jgi:hypothetical protein
VVWSLRGSDVNRGVDGGQHAAEGLWQLTIDKQIADLRQMPHADHCIATELGDVGDQENPPGVRDDGACDQDFAIIEVEQGTIGIDPGSADDLDALSVTDLTNLAFEGRRPIIRNLEYIRVHLPGFERAYLLETAPQTGVRQTRLLTGAYIMTKDDVTEGRGLRGRRRSRSQLLHAVQNLVAHSC